MAKKKLLLTLGVGYLCTQLPNINKVNIKEDLNIAEVNTNAKQIIIFITNKNKCDSIFILCINNKSNNIKVVKFKNKLKIQNENIIELYNNLGATSVISKLNESLGFSIQNYVKLDYLALIEVIEKLGGLKVKLNEYDKKLIFLDRELKEKESCVLNSEEVVKYISFKSEKGCTKKDIRQKRAMKSLINNLMELSPKEFSRIVSNVIPFIETTMSTKELVIMGVTCIKIGIDNVEKVFIPTKNNVMMVNSKVDDYKIENFIDEINNVLCNW